jgi:hypothetical protein
MDALLGGGKDVAVKARGARRFEAAKAARARARTLSRRCAVVGTATGALAKREVSWSISRGPRRCTNSRSWALCLARAASTSSSRPSAARLAIRARQVSS